MKPFEKGKTYKDANGRNVTIVDADYNGRLLGVMEIGAGKACYAYSKDGRHSSVQDWNLVQEKTKIEGWVRIWERDGKCWFGDICKSEEAAKRHSRDTYGRIVGVVKVEWEG